MTNERDQGDQSEPQIDLDRIAYELSLPNDVMPFLRFGIKPPQYYRYLESRELAEHGYITDRNVAVVNQQVLGILEAVQSDSQTGESRLPLNGQHVDHLNKGIIDYIRQQARLSSLLATAQDQGQVGSQPDTYDTTILYAHIRVTNEMAALRILNEAYANASGTYRHSYLSYTNGGEDSSSTTIK